MIIASGSGIQVKFESPGLGREQNEKFRKGLVCIFLAMAGRLHILLRFVNEQETAVLFEKVKLCILLSGYARTSGR
jgi:hypothetical protein